MIDAPFPFETNNDPPEQRIAVSAPGLIELIYEIREFPIILRNERAIVSIDGRRLYRPGIWTFRISFEAIKACGKSNKKQKIRLWLQNPPSDVSVNSVPAK